MRDALDLVRLEQVHVALGSTARLEDFYLILASLLVDPNAFGYSRAFLFRYDDRTRCFAGSVALGARSLEDHRQARAEIEQETRMLKDQIEAIQKESPEPAAVKPLYDLRYHSLWIRLLQERDEDSSQISSFEDIVVRRDGLQPDHLVELAANAARAIIVKPGEASLEGIETFVSLPAVAGRLVTRRGLNCILVADRLFEETPADEEALYEFQGLLNHAAVSLENVALLTEATRTTERLREVDRLKSNFLSIVSHELRTPLTSIIGFVQLLANETVGSLSDGQRDLVRRISQHSNHLQSMVSDVIEIAEVEAGGMIDVDCHPVDPLKSLYAAIPKIQQRHADRKPLVEPVIHGRVPLVLADERSLERVYYHLLDNAVKFSKQVGSRVAVEFSPPHDGVLDISIVDQGIGISKEHLKEIFNHFYQVDFRLDRAYGGLGIGLTVVKALSDAIATRITVESTVGVGSRFTLSVPLAE